MRSRFSLSQLRTCPPNSVSQAIAHGLAHHRIDRFGVGVVRLVEAGLEHEARGARRWRRRVHAPVALNFDGWLRGVAARRLLSIVSEAGVSRSGYYFGLARGVVGFMRWVAGWQ